jgi:hypothetical protein
MIDLMRDVGGQVEIINPTKIKSDVLKSPPRKKHLDSKKKEEPQETE